MSDRKTFNNIKRGRRFLKCLYALLENEEHWCKGARATTADNKPVSPRSKYARSWSVAGAIQRSKYPFKPQNINIARAIAHQAIREVIAPKQLDDFNDESNHFDILRLLRDADEILIKRQEVLLDKLNLGIKSTANGGNPQKPKSDSNTPDNNDNKDDDDTDWGF